MDDEDISIFVGNLGTVEGPADIRLFFEKENIIVRSIEMKFGFAFVYIAGTHSLTLSLTHSLTHSLTRLFMYQE